MPIDQRINIVFHNNKWWLTVLWKHRHTWDDRGRFDPQPTSEPLRDTYTYEEDLSRSPCALLRHDRDTWPIKFQTDVVVHGAAMAPDGRPVMEMKASVIVRPHTRQQVAKTIDVVGTRWIYFDRMGGLCFSNPEPFATQSTDWWYAYGGIDPFHLPTAPQTPTLFGKPLLELFPGAYPRNPLGCGFWASPTTVPDGMLLPNLETPDQRLDRARLVLNDPRAWIHRPTPAGFGWLSATTWPRCVHGAHRPFYLPEDTNRIPEVHRGLIPAELVRPGPGNLTLNASITRVAAPGLEVGYLFGGETIRLIGFSPRGPFDLPLPRLRQTCHAIDRHPSRTRHTGLPCLQSVAIDTDAHHVDLLWSTRFQLPADRYGAWLESRPSHDDLNERFTILLDQQELGRQAWAA